MTTVLFGKNSSNPLPMIEKLWEFYSNKGIKTVFISIGTSSSPVAELEIADMLGCPLHVVEWDEVKLAGWDSVKKVLNTRKSTSISFTKNVENKWVLPTNLRISSALPFFYTGSIDVSGLINTIDINLYVKNICEKMAVSEKRIDLFNVQVGNEMEIPILFTLLNSTYRPGLICISYTHNPDSNLLSMQLAGHIQNIGYALIAKEEHKFLYMFKDNNAYEFASYEDTTVDNPLIYEIIKEATNIRDLGISNT